MGNREGVESARPGPPTAGFEEAVIRGIVRVCYRRGLTRPQAIERCRAIGLDRADRAYVEDAYDEFEGESRRPGSDWSLLTD